MESYYEDKWVKIYNCTSFIFNSDTVILDPPKPLEDADKFKAKIYIIFCGKLFPFYASQFHSQIIIRSPWQFVVEGDEHVYSDTVLYVGRSQAPGRGLYQMPPANTRSNKWERPLPLMLNLLTESEGDVLDPFMGGGNSMVACKMLGRKGIGFEIDERLCRIAAERCSAV